MAKKEKDKIEKRGRVVKTLPNATFKIEPVDDDGPEIIGHLSGKMRYHHIKILPGDEVKVELSPYDESRGRIVYRY